MSAIYQQTAVFRFLKIAELWGQETDTDMWTVARIMATGTVPSKNESPLIIHHISMLDVNGNHISGGGFRNPKLLDALNTLIHDAPDQPVKIILEGLHDMCISKEYFRHWCIEKFPLPNFWFTEKERVTISEAEKAQIKQAGRISIEDLNKHKSIMEAFEFKPSIRGLSVDLKKIYEHQKNKKEI